MNIVNKYSQEYWGRRLDQRLHHTHQHQSSSCGYNVTRFARKVNLDGTTSQVLRMRNLHWTIPPNTVEYTHHQISTPPGDIKASFKNPWTRVSQVVFEDVSPNVHCGPYNYVTYIVNGDKSMAAWCTKLFVHPSINTDLEAKMACKPLVWHTWVLIHSANLRATSCTTNPASLKRRGSIICVNHLGCCSKYFLSNEFMCLAGQILDFFMYAVQKVTCSKKLTGQNSLD